jgi:hypothetical protein
MSYDFKILQRSYLKHKEENAQKADISPLCLQVDPKRRGENHLGTVMLFHQGI